jgi:hypothetical protein
MATITGQATDPVSPGVLGQPMNIDLPGTFAIGVKGDGGSGFPGPAVVTPGRIAIGVLGTTSDPQGAGVQGENTAGGTAGEFFGNVSVSGNISGGAGVSGTSQSGVGVSGQGAIGVEGTGQEFGVIGNGSGSGPGVKGVATQAPGLVGNSDSVTGVYGFVAPGPGFTGQLPISAPDSKYNGNASIVGESVGQEQWGVLGLSHGSGGIGVAGIADGAGASGVNGVGGPSGNGVLGQCSSGNAICGETTASSGNYAGFFRGNVQITGTLFKSAGGFWIDHPLDRERKYLAHSFVESHEMINVYAGNTSLDESGEACVGLPLWFEALNEDFRYQLTCVGSYGPVFVAEEIQEGRFKIAGGRPGMKVSWQVIGRRHDEYARQHPIPIEIEKPSLKDGDPSAFP